MSQETTQLNERLITEDKWRSKGSALQQTGTHRIHLFKAAEGIIILKLRGNCIGCFRFLFDGSSVSNLWSLPWLQSVRRLSLSQSICGKPNMIGLYLMGSANCEAPLHANPLWPSVTSCFLDPYFFSVTSPQCTRTSIIRTYLLSFSLSLSLSIYIYIYIYIYT
jgi:hypothetical protein